MTPYQTTETAARMYFWLVDATDGLTSEVGEAGGQPDVSVNGAAWGTTGISTLTHIGNGQYYATVNLSTLGVSAGDTVIGRYKSANTAEAPSLNELIAYEMDPTAEASYGGSGATHMVTLQSSVDDIQTDTTAIIATQADHTTDLTNIEAKVDIIDTVVDAISVLCTDIQGSGFATGTHSLVALRNYLASVIVPLVETSTTLSALNAQSTVSRMIEYTRRATDEPSVNAKYTDSELIEFLRDAWGEMWVDLNNNSENPVMAWYQITLVTDVSEYILPPQVGQVLRVFRLTANDEVLGEVDERGLLDPQGYGYRIEGNRLLLSPSFKDTYKLEIHFIPGGEVSFITGTWNSSEIFSGDTVTLNGTPTSGVLDTRPNCYAGYMLRCIPPAGTTPTAGDGETVVQERLIESYDETALEATLGSDIIAIDVTGTSMDYEVLPYMTRDMQRCMAQRAAMTILSMEGHTTRLNTATTEYQRIMRSVRLYLTNRNSRRASQFRGGEPENRSRMRAYGPYSRYGRRF